MPKQNPYFIPKENYKKVEEVRFWDYEIKTSKLSPAARSKIIKKYGGDYVSESREDYGPCFDNPRCNKCSNEELERQVIQLKLQREKEELEAERKQRNRTFRLWIHLNRNVLFFDYNSCSASNFAENISEAARNAEDILNCRGHWKEVDCPQSDREKLYDRIHRQIDLYKRGFDVDTSVGNT